MDPHPLIVIFIVSFYILNLLVIISQTNSQFVAIFKTVLIH